MGTQTFIGPSTKIIDPEVCQDKELKWFNNSLR